MFPSWMRSRNCRPRFVYFLAIETTRRRFASTSSLLAFSASRSPRTMKSAVCRSSSAEVSIAVSVARMSASAAKIFSRSSLRTRESLESLRRRR
jgi:hypothetical protein